MASTRVRFLPWAPHDVALPGVSIGWRRVPDHGPVTSTKLDDVAPAETAAAQRPRPRPVGVLADLYNASGCSTVADIVRNYLGDVRVTPYEIFVLRDTYLAAINAQLAPTGVRVDEHGPVLALGPIDRDEVRALLDDAFDYADLPGIVSDFQDTRRF